MALEKADLTQSLTELFEGTEGLPESETEAAAKLAEAYRGYAANASAGPTWPVEASLSAAESTLSGALAAAFAAAKSAGAAGVPALGTAIDAALVTFWIAPPVALAAPPTGPPSIAGIVTVAPPGVQAGGLSALFLAGVANKATPGDQAEAMASILDAWIRTVMVVNTPINPPGPALPPVPLA